MTPEDVQLLEMIGLRPVMVDGLEEDAVLVRTHHILLVNCAITPSRLEWITDELILESAGNHLDDYRP